MEIVVVGHLSRDLLVTPEIRRETLGGGTAYAMLAPAIGAHGAGIVSRVGRDFEQEYIDALRNSGLDLTGLHMSGPVTTRFVNEYDEHGERTQRIEALAPSLSDKDLLPSHNDTSVVHFCPLTADEIHTSCFEAMASKEVLVSLDVQGFLRPSRLGPVEPTEWKDPERVLRHVDILKADEEEILLGMQAETEERAVEKALRYGPEIVIVTREQRGSTIFLRDSHVDIPAVFGEWLVDETGAGDTYMVGFLIEYVRSGNVERAGLFGATCASFNLEHVGPYKMPTREQVEERMSRRL